MSDGFSIFGRTFARLSLGLLGAIGIIWSAIQVASWASDNVGLTYVVGVVAFMFGCVLTWALAVAYFKSKGSRHQGRD